MKNLTSKIFPILCLAIFILSSCTKEDVCTDHLTSDDEQAVYLFNAYQQFAGSLDALNIVELTAAGFVTELGASATHEANYAINFPVGSKDVMGNVVSGEIIVNVLKANMASDDNEVSYSFIDFDYNGLEFSGIKLSYTNEEGEDCWGTGPRPGVSDGGGMVIKPTTGNAVAFGLQGEIRKSMTDDYAIIRGYSVINFGNKSYRIDVADDIHMTADCAWFNAGELIIQEGSTMKNLTYENNCSSPLMTLTNENRCEIKELTKVQNLW